MLKLEPAESNTAVSDDRKESEKHLNSKIDESISGLSVAAKPLYVYPLLTAAIVAVSSAAVAFSSMSEISPCLLAFWRTQFTAVLLLPAGVYSIWRMTDKERQRMVEQGHMICISGILLGCHFGTWVLCIENTSLPHALLVGSSAPIIIAIGAWVMRKPISKGELIGTAIAAIGMLLISQSAGTEKQVTIYGDLIGLVSSCLYVLYLSIGRTLRTWMPIFSYVFPLFSIATITLAVAALCFEGAKLDATTSGLFGQYGSWHYLWRSLYLGAVPGILGHVSFNALLKWLHPLVIALAGSTEPIIGVAIGLLVGVGHVPGFFTYLGGSILIASTILVIISSYKREKADPDDAVIKAEAIVGLVNIHTEETAVEYLNEDDGEQSSDVNDEEAQLLHKDAVEKLEELVVEDFLDDSGGEKQDTQHATDS